MPSITVQVHVVDYGRPAVGVSGRLSARSSLSVIVSHTDRDIFRGDSAKLMVRTLGFQSTCIMYSLAPESHTSKHSL